MVKELEARELEARELEESLELCRVQDGVGVLGEGV